MEQWDGCGERREWPSIHPVSRKHLAHKSPESKTCWSEELLTTSALMDSSPWLLLTRSAAIQGLESGGNIRQGSWVPSCGGDSGGWEYGYCWETHRTIQENSTRFNRYLYSSRCIWISVNVLVKAKKLGPLSWLRVPAGAKWKLTRWLGTLRTWHPSRLPQ